MALPAGGLVKGEVVTLPTIRVEQHQQPRVALVEIFGGRVGDAEIERFLTELHKRGLYIAAVEDGSGD